MNALSLVDLYNCLKEDEDFRAAFPPVAVIFGAKAAAGYDRAKSIIYFCNKVAERINGDPRGKRPSAAWCLCKTTIAPMPSVSFPPPT